jgi:hypothetical protein
MDDSTSELMEDSPQIPASPVSLSSLMQEGVREISRVVHPTLCPAGKACCYENVIASVSKERDNDSDLSADKAMNVSYTLRIKPGPLQQANKVSFVLSGSDYVDTDLAMSKEGEQEVKDLNVEKQEETFKMCMAALVMEVTQDVDTGKMEFMLNKKAGIEIQKEDTEACKADAQVIRNARSEAFVTAAACALARC